MISVDHFWAKPEENFEMLNDWRIKRSLKPVYSSELPDIGLVVLNDNEPVAIGFLRNAEGIGLIDSIVTNPDMKGEIRDKALNVVFEKLISIARMIDMKRLMGTSVDSHTIERLKKFGFIQADSSVMIMSLGGN